MSNYAMLSKLNHVLNKKLVYYQIFEFHLCYASLVWAQKTNSFERLHLLQKQSLRMIFFFRVEIPTQTIYLKTSEFSSPLTRLLLKIAFLLAKL